MSTSNAHADGPSGFSDITQRQISLGLGLLQRSPDSPNLVVSPYSVHTALTLARIGAKGKTAAELDALLFSTQYSQALLEKYAALNANVAAQGDSATVTLSNSIWITKEGTFKKRFVDEATKGLQAATYSVDFKDAEKTRNTINAWVAERTEGKIPELLPQGIIGPDFLATLINALYFKAAWDTPFPAASTRDDAFWTTPSTQRTVNMMETMLPATYFEDERWQAVSMPYARGAYSFLLLLPKEKRAPKQVVSELSMKLIEEARKGQTRAYVQLRMPRFSVRKASELREVLSLLGIGQLFSADADLSDISELALRVSAVQHESFISVDEKGTEASAATAVMISKSSAALFQQGPKTVTADHPFAFTLMHAESGAPLFVGVVGEP